MSKLAMLERFALVDDDGEVHCTPKEIYPAMDEFAEDRSIAFAEWMNEEDCQLTPDGWVRKKENYEYYMPIEMLYNTFLQSHKQ